MRHQGDQAAPCPTAHAPAHAHAFPHPPPPCLPAQVRLWSMAQQKCLREADVGFPVAGCTFSCEAYPSRAKRGEASVHLAFGSVGDYRCACSFGGGGGEVEREEEKGPKALVPGWPGVGACGCACREEDIWGAGRCGCGARVLASACITNETSHGQHSKARESADVPSRCRPLCMPPTLHTCT